MLLHASAESYSTPLQYQLLGKYSASCCDKTKPLKIHNYEDSIKNKKKPCTAYLYPLITQLHV